MDDTDDIPVLSGDSLAALQEFYAERNEDTQRAADLKYAVENGGKLSMSMFKEDWNASQFWYDEETAQILAEQLHDGADNDTAIAVISAPSAFIELKNILNAAGPEGVSPTIVLLEYDNRFAALKEFVNYDYQKPLSLPAELKGRFDCILCDPPFLSEECQTKAAMTVRWLSKSRSTRIIVCTGERMEPLIHKLYPGLKTTNFEPEHAQGRLGNEFRCYANFRCSVWNWQ